MWQMKLKINKLNNQQLMSLKSARFVSDRMRIVTRPMCKHDVSVEPYLRVRNFAKYIE